MSRHRIIDPTSFSSVRLDDLPARRPIEVAEVEELAAADPPKQMVEREPYRPSGALAEAVDLAIALGRPLLLQGDPGCGKTRLAYAVAYALGLPLEECYIKSTTRAQDLLYTYDAVRRLYDSQLGADGPRDPDSHPLCRDVRNYVRLGPLGRAIARASFGRRSVVLLDEIDKADLDFPNDLLYEIDRLAFRIAEAPGTGYAVEDPRLRPILFVTHNEEKALPTAFLRRCIFHYLEFPATENDLRAILALHEVGDEDLAPRAIEVVQRLRALPDLTKKPGLSELIDWVAYLKEVNVPPDALDRFPYLGVLLKQQADLDRAQKTLGGG